MFLKLNFLSGVANNPQKTCPGISCGATCQLESADIKNSTDVASNENKESVKAPSSPNSK